MNFSIALKTEVEVYWLFVQYLYSSFYCRNPKFLFVQMNQNIHCKTHVNDMMSTNFVRSWFISHLKTTKEKKKKLYSQKLFIYPAPIHDQHDQ